MFTGDGTWSSGTELWMRLSLSSSAFAERSFAGNLASGCGQVYCRSPFYVLNLLGMKEYSLQKAFLKLVQFLVIVSPLVIQVLPQEWANLTLSGALLLLVNYLKVKYL
jgi:hypothetical protein